jgi:putative copper export protein
MWVGGSVKGLAGGWVGGIVVDMRWEASAMRTAMRMKMRRAGWVVIAAALLAASGANCGGSY